MGWMERMWRWGVGGAVRNAEAELRHRQLAIAGIDAACRRLAPEPDRVSQPRSA